MSDVKRCDTGPAFAATMYDNEELSPYKSGIGDGPLVVGQSSVSRGGEEEKEPPVPGEAPPWREAVRKKLVLLVKARMLEQYSRGPYLFLP